MPKPLLSTRRRMSPAAHPSGPCADGTLLLLAAVGGGLALWDTVTRRRTRALAGHAAAAEGAISLAFSPDGALCFSAARSDRAVAVWSVHGGGDSKGPRPALARLSLADGMPLQLSSCAARGAARVSGDCLLVAVSTLGEAHVWLLGADGQAAGAQQRLRLASPNAVSRGAAEDCILAAAAVAEEDSAGATPLFSFLFPELVQPPGTVLFSVAGPHTRASPPVTRCQSERVHGQPGSGLLPRSMPVYADIRLSLYPCLGDAPDATRRRFAARGTRHAGALRL